MKPTSKIFKDYYNQKLISKLNLNNNSFEKEIKTKVLDWSFTINLN